MNLQAAHSRLCHLIDNSLRSYGEVVFGTLAPEIAKDLLISLSQVYRQIKQWTLEFNSDSDDETVKKPSDGSDASTGSDSHPDDHHCMAKIIGHLVSLFSLENPLIQHLTGNTLVAISEFVAASETGWNEYMHLLCHWLKFAIHSALSSSKGHVFLETKDLEFDFLISVLPLKLRPENVNYLTVASIIRVLRNILKHLKLNANAKLLEAYLDSITDSVSNVPWDSLREAYVVSNADLPLKCAAQSKSITIIHGNLVQLFCSLVHTRGLTEAGPGSDTHPVLFEIRNIIPKFLSSCFLKPENWEDVCMFHYLRHKILMLLMRLIFIVHLEHSDLISWLHLIEKYFQDLLLQPLNSRESSQNDCLEGSPFWTHDFDAEKQRFPPSHLRRLAVFLFLRCSLTLVSLKEKADEKLALANSVSCSTFGHHFSSECSTRSDGLLVLQKWLQRQLPSDIFVNQEMYSQRCTNFASSFLKLYIHEDDILFEMLLQLFHLPCYSKKLGGTPSTAKNGMFCLVSDLFNPLHFFHLFLSEILYDHQVLLDYLISKDTGAKSAEYLLRCLRMVCDSWNVFVEFPAWGESSNPLCQKRRRVLADGVDFEDSMCTASLEDGLAPSPLKTECKIGGHSYGSKHGGTGSLSIKDAMGCLVSLKTSIDSLYQKNLFPYNPQVLLRRLLRFQELCLKEMQLNTAF